MAVENEETTANGDFAEAQNDSLPPPPVPPSDGVEEGQDHPNERQPKRRWLPRDIKLAEWIMIAFTAVTALAAWAGVYVARGQLKAMNAQLAEMRSGGVDTHDIAQATADFAKAMKDQAANTKQLVAATQSSAKAAEGAASATVRGATAQIKTANAEIQAVAAQQAAAEAETKATIEAAAATRPSIALESFSINGFKNAPETSGAFKGGIFVDFNYKYVNTGGSPWKLIDNAQTIVLLRDLPKNPDYSKATHLYGHGLVIFKGNWMTLTGNPKILVSQEDAKMVLRQHISVFVYGIITYDVYGAIHKFCYAYAVPIDDSGNGQRFIEVGSAAYHCDT